MGFGKVLDGFRRFWLVQGGSGLVVGASGSLAVGKKPLHAGIDKSADGDGGGLS